MAQSHPIAFCNNIASTEIQRLCSEKYGKLHIALGDELIEAIKQYLEGREHISKKPNTFQR